MSKHTLPPWREFYHETAQANIVCPNGDPIAVTFRRTDSESEPSDPECDANTRLIVAAPEMLAALKSAEAALEATLKARGYEPGSCTDEWSAEVRGEVAALANVRAAIAKAEGRQ